MRLFLCRAAISITLPPLLQDNSGSCRSQQLAAIPPHTPPPPPLRTAVVTNLREGGRERFAPPRQRSRRRGSPPSTGTGPRVEGSRRPSAPAHPHRLRRARTVNTSRLNLAYFFFLFGNVDRINMCFHQSLSKWQTFKCCALDFRIKLFSD